MKFEIFVPGGTYISGVQILRDRPDRMVLCRICAVCSGLTFEARQRRVAGVRRGVTECLDASTMQYSLIQLVTTTSQHLPQ